MCSITRLLAIKKILICNHSKMCKCSFTFMHLADAFIQSDLQLHSGYTFSLVYVFPGNRTHNLLRWWRNALPLSHRNTNSVFNNSMHLKIVIYFWILCIFFTNKSKLTYKIHLFFLRFDVTILRRDYAMTSSRNDIITSFSNLKQQIDLPLATFSENELATLLRKSP